MGNYLAEPDINLEKDFTSGTNKTVQFAGINVQGWKKSQQDFVIHQLDINRNNYRSPKAVEREFSKLKYEIINMMNELTEMEEEKSESEEEHSKSNSPKSNNEEIKELTE